MHLSSALPVSAVCTPCLLTEHGIGGLRLDWCVIECDQRIPDQGSKDINGSALRADDLILEVLLFYFRELNITFSKCTSLHETSSTHSNNVTLTEVFCNLEPDPEGHGPLSNEQHSYVQTHMGTHASDAVYNHTYMVWFQQQMNVCMVFSILGFLLIFHTSSI